jgi:hypothetical protein
MTVIRMVPALALAAGGILAGARTHNSALPVVRPNPNVERAGVLQDGVLTVTLEAKPSLWFLDGPHHPAITVEAFSEPGKPPLMPAPLVRDS